MMIEGAQHVMNQEEEWAFGKMPQCYPFDGFGVNR